MNATVTWSSIQEEWQIWPEQSSKTLTTTCHTSAFHNISRLICRLGTTGRIKIATDVGATNMKEKGIPSTLRKLPSLDSLLSPSLLHPPQLHDPTGSKPRYKDVRPPSHHSGEFVAAIRLSLFINIISASRIYLGRNSGICHSNFIRGRKPLNSSDGGWSRVAWRLSTRSDAERKCEGVWVIVYNASCSNLIFVKNPSFIGSGIFICELGWRICWRQF